MKNQYNFRKLSDKQCSNCSNLLKAKNANKGFALCYPCYNVLNGRINRTVERTNIDGSKNRKTINYKQKQGK